MSPWSTVNVRWIPVMEIQGAMAILFRRLPYLQNGKYAMNALSVGAIAYQKKLIGTKN